MVAGVRRNGPVWPHAQRTAERRQHTCSALLPRRNIGSEVVAICLCSDKMKYKYGRGIYRYEMWLSLALKIMALSTQLHWSTFHTHKICTSEQNWPSSWTCLCLGAPALHRGSKASSCNWRWRMSWSAGCTLWGEVYWPIRDPKKVRPKNCIVGRRCIKT